MNTVFDPQPHLSTTAWIVAVAGQARQRDPLTTPAPRGGPRRRRHPITAVASLTEIPGILPPVAPRGTRTGQTHEIPVDTGIMPAPISRRSCVGARCIADRAAYLYGLMVAGVNRAIEILQTGVIRTMRPRDLPEELSPRHVTQPWRLGPVSTNGSRADGSALNAAMNLAGIRPSRATVRGPPAGNCR